MFGFNKKMTAEERRSYEMEADFRIMSAGELCDIGYAYDTGTEGKPQDKERAIQYYLKAAEMGNVYAQFNAGYCYYFGNGTEQDISQSEIWFLEAAKQQHDAAYYLLALIYLCAYQEEEDEEDEPDYDRAIYWCERAASVETCDTISAKKKLLEIYSDDESNYYDGEKAMYWLNTLARNGDEEAIEKLGSNGEDYPSETWVQFAEQYNTDKKKNKDPEKVTYWYHKAALAGDVKSMCIFANRLMENEDADEIDLKEAFYWHKTAAEEVFEHSQFQLIHMYKDGIGVEKNREEALYWTKKAFDEKVTDDASKVTVDPALEYNVKRMKIISNNYAKLVSEVNNFSKGSYDVDFDMDPAELLYQAACFWFYDQENYSMALECAEIAAMRRNTNAGHLAALCYVRTSPEFASKNSKLASWWMSYASNNGVKDAIDFRKRFPALFTNDNLMDRELMAKLSNEYYDQDDYIRRCYWSSVLSKKEGYESFAFSAGKCQYHGEGTWKNQKDYQMALDFFVKSLADTPDSSAHYIAEIYLTGGYGMERNLKEAVNWYKKAISAYKMYGKEVSSNLYTDLAHACMKLGKESDALDYYKKAEKLALINSQVIVTEETDEDGNVRVTRRMYS